MPFRYRSGGLCSAERVSFYFHWPLGLCTLCAENENVERTSSPLQPDGDTLASEGMVPDVKRPLAALAVLLLGTLIVSCGSDPQPVAATPSTTVVTTTVLSKTTSVSKTTVTTTVTATPGAGPATLSSGGAVTVPAGFDAYGVFFGGRFADITDAENTECGASACWPVEAWTAIECPAGIQVKLTVYDGPADNDAAPVLQTVTQKLKPAGSIEAGSTTRVLVKASRANATSDRLSAELTDVACA